MRALVRGRGRRAVATFLAVALLAACGSDDGDTASGADGGEGGEVAVGGTLRLGVASLPGEQGNVWAGGVIAPGVYATWPFADTLTVIDEEGTAQPSLAESWEMTSDTTWTVQLREGVEFQNGEPFNADTVVHNLTFLRSEEGTATVTGNDIFTVAGAEAVDEHTVEITTTQPDPILPNRLAAVMVVPAEYFDEVGLEGFAAEPIGTGPFQVTSWTSDKVTYERFEGSWREANLDALEIQQIPDPSARLQALQSDQIDISLGLDVDQVDSLEPAGLEMVAEPASQVLSLAFCLECGDSPIADPEVRVALNHAVDRDGIIENIYRGLTAAAHQGATPLGFGYHEDLEPYEYDPELAKDMLAEAGYPDGFDLTAEVMVGTLTGDSLLFQAVKDDLSEIGVDLELVVRPFPEWLDRYSALNWDGETFELGWNTSPIGDMSRPLASWSCLRTPAHFCDEDQLALITAANSELDQDARLEALREVAEAMRENPPALFLTQDLDIFALRDDVEGFSSSNRFIDYASLGLAG